MRIVLVGCGSSKRDKEIEPGTIVLRTYPAEDLYTSTYFSKKREYAEVIGDQWAILSADHGLLFPGDEIAPYDLSIDDLDEDERASWSRSVLNDLIDWMHYELSDGAEFIEVEILAGKGYVDPLRDAIEPGTIPRDSMVRFPFDETTGLPDQMRWLTQEIERYHPGAQEVGDA